MNFGEEVIKNSIIILTILANNIKKKKEVFWILAMLVENILPNDYYTTMIGTLCDS